MNHLPWAAAIMLVLAFQVASDFGKHSQCAGHFEPVLCPAKPQKVSGTPVLVPNEIASVENASYSSLGAPCIITSPYFGAGQIAVFGS